MKNWLLFLFCLSAYFSQAQTASIPYQSILTDREDAILNNVTAELKVDIIENAQSGSVVYSETHVIVSGNNGELYINIGEGQDDGISFDQVDWSKPNYIELSVKPDGFSNFFSVGTRQLLSVPYAIFALNVSCDDGCPGEPGKDGAIGPTGLPGPVGATGFTAPVGPPGPTGIMGDSGAETLSMTSDEPLSPIENQFYIDDGSNRVDGLPGIRFFDGTSWIDI